MTAAMMAQGIGGLDDRNLDCGDQPGSEGCRHEQPDLEPVHWHADIMRGQGRAACAKDPVADARIEQHPSRQGHGNQPPDNGDWEACAADGNINAKDRMQHRIANRVIDIADLRASGDQTGQRDGQPANNKEAAQRNNKGWQPCTHDQVAVDKTNQQRQRKGNQRSQI